MFSLANHLTCQKACSVKYILEKGNWKCREAAWLDDPSFVYWAEWYGTYPEYRKASLNPSAVLKDLNS